MLSPFKSKEKTFLEIGCGSCSLLYHLAGEFACTVGLDISSVALQQATKRFTTNGIRSPILLLGDCFKLPFQDESFDVIWSQGLHEHFSNYEEIFSEDSSFKEHLTSCKISFSILSNGSPIQK